MVLGVACAVLIPWCWAARPCVCMGVVDDSMGLGVSWCHAHPTLTCSGVYLQHFACAVHIRNLMTKSHLSIGPRGVRDCVSGDRAVCTMWFDSTYASPVVRAARVCPRCVVQCVGGRACEFVVPPARAARELCRPPLYIIGMRSS